MNTKYRERPQQPLCKWNEIQWEQPKQLEDTISIRFCWPLTNEAQMWEQVRCRECNQPARWVGIGSPFGDGEQYFMAADAWCYWCLPPEHFTDEELRLVRHDECVRKQTVDEIIELIRHARLLTDDKTVESALSVLIDEIEAATDSRESRMQKRAQWEESFNRGKGMGFFAGPVK
jgi:hypothetical protein